ncbi:hypothetical protein P692DRAFT_20735253 [Suillus brevipes Sb2]|nr:hypothetical protein P692DRAFT_20735253 [Suillus brevipes Sb2]
MLRVRNMTPKVWPNWHSIGYDDLHLKKHAWSSKILAWEQLGDASVDLPVAAPPSLGLIPVDLPSPPIVAGNIAGPSNNPATEVRETVLDKGKGKANLAPEAEGSRKRKSPMISALSSQPLKSALKTHKRVKSTCMVKSNEFVESEDDDSVVQPISRGEVDVVLPHLSTIIARTPNSPRSPRSPKKKPFGPDNTLTLAKLYIIIYELSL